MFVVSTRKRVLELRSEGLTLTRMAGQAPFARAPPHQWCARRQPDREPPASLSGLSPSDRESRGAEQATIRGCVTSSGSPYARFKRALLTGNLALVRAAAAELPA